MGKRRIVYILLFIFLICVLVIGVIVVSSLKKEEDKDAFNGTGGKYDHEIEIAFEITEILKEFERHTDKIWIYIFDSKVKVLTSFDDVKEGDILELHSGTFIVDNEKKNVPKVGDVIYVSFFPNQLREKDGLHIIDNGEITVVFSEKKDSE
ncbi:MAG: hypothetical protein IKU06_04890 [Lachnospiraceae bacterium]|nr:hypothetical protein [Lachnospiraceae bacterium]